MPFQSKNSGHHIKVSKILFFANALEFYDLMIYALFYNIFAKQFIEPVFQNNSVLISWLAFSTAFLARPFGAIFFGYIGDCFGRKRALLSSLMGMSLATFCIGILPDFNVLGIWAPLLLFSLRFVQGFCVGGECNGYAIVVLETTSGKRRYYSSMILASTFMGALFGLIVSMLLSISHYSNYWRITFLIGSLLGLLTMYLRKRLMDNHENLASRQSFIGLLRIIKSFAFNFVSLVLLSGINGSVCYLLLGYLNTYLRENHNISKEVIFFYILIGISATIITLLSAAKLIPFSRYEKELHKAVFLNTIISLILCGFSLLLVEINNSLYIFIGVTILGSSVAILGLDLHRYAISLFPAMCRYSSVSMAFSVGMALFGGYSPTIYYQLTHLGGLELHWLILYPLLLTLLYGLTLSWPKRVISCGSGKRA